MVKELEVRFDSRKSFYKKAHVIENDGVKKLQSYNTIVAQIEDGIAKVYGTYSPTTLRHIKEFLKQNGLKADTKAQIEELYIDQKKEK